MLMAMAAEAQAAESIAESEAIRAAAAADAVRALITAGLLEEAAVHEAVEALSAVGLTIAAADEAAAASVAEYAEAVLAAGDATAEAVAEAGATVRAASITVAEARVLHYLPTPASFAVIGDKLGISREAARQRAERQPRHVRDRGLGARRSDAQAICAHTAARGPVPRWRG
jgi:biotin operon repressor